MTRRAALCRPPNLGREKEGMVSMGSRSPHQRWRRSCRDVLQKVVRWRPSESRATRSPQSSHWIERIDGPPYWRSYLSKKQSARAVWRS